MPDQNVTITTTVAPYAFPHVSGRRVMSIEVGPGASLGHLPDMFISDDGTVELDDIRVSLATARQWFRALLEELDR